MNRPIWLDLETRSAVDVTVSGVDRLCEDPTLQVLTLHYAIGDAAPRTWRGAFGEPRGEVPGDCGPAPAGLLIMIEAGATVYMHNARFDRLVWNAALAARFGWPRIEIEQTRDSASLCRLANWPAALKGAAERAGGEKLPNATFRTLWSNKHPMGPDAKPLFEQMIAYGEGDVVEMRRVVKTLPEPHPGFWEEWVTSEVINDRGFQVDTDWCRRAAAARELLTAQESANLVALTGGMVQTPKQSQAARVWFEMLLGQEFMVAKKKRLGGDEAGFRTEKRAGFDKAVRAKLREELLEDVGNNAAPLALDVLDAIDAGSGAAVAKYDAALERVSSDGRLRGSYIFRGAAQTGRYSAGGLQPHNLVRHKAKDVAAERAAAATIKDYGKMLRSTVIASQGATLCWSDWSAIEARITPWLADADDCPTNERESLRAVLEIFRSGGDVYLHAAGQIYRHEVTAEMSEKRQAGKVSTLALGFGGSVGALMALARGYGLKIDNAAEIVTAWHAANPWAKGFYRRVEQAAFQALRNRGHAYAAGRLILVAEAGALLMILPDGSYLSYPNPRVDMVDRFESGEEQATVTFLHPVFGRSAFSGPICSENPTQAVAARLLTGALVEARREGLDVVMHTHDEIVIEAPDGLEDVFGPILADIMETVPAWAKGLPLAVEWNKGKFYHAKG